MQHDDKIPGVTFFVEGAHQLPPADEKRHLARGQVTLGAEITDFDVWKEVLEKLNGLRIYTVQDLAEAMISISQKKHGQLRDEFTEYKKKSNSELQILKQQVSLLESQRDAFQEANEKWAEWSAALKEMSGNMDA